MTIERYCSEKNCKGDKCDAHARKGGCPFEYVAADYAEEFRWKGDEAPPKYWWVGSTKVYRSYADYCD